MIKYSHSNPQISVAASGSVSAFHPRHDNRAKDEEAGHGGGHGAVDGTEGSKMLSSDDAGVSGSVKAIGSVSCRGGGNSSGDRKGYRQEGREAVEDRPGLLCFPAQGLSHDDRPGGSSQKSSASLFRPPVEVIKTAAVAVLEGVTTVAVGGEAHSPRRYESC